MGQEAKMTNEQPVSDSSAPQVETAPLKGIVGTKIGMTRIFLENSDMVPVTVISTEGNIVTQIKTKEKDGYSAVQVGYGDVAEKKLSKAEAQHLSKKGLPLKRWLREFHVSDSGAFKVGQPVPANVFSKGEMVQVSGLTRGKGYAGVMKRHGFAGLPHSHGNGEYRRHPGSNGAQGPQHVLPGTRKPGRMGHVWSTVPKIEIVDVDTEKNLILLRGSVPGPNGNFVVLKPTSRAVKISSQPKQQAKPKAKK
ncbi:MAG: 50S ribosomal protein L3 [Elusimicrobia bacterium]|nr:50S ribosomal protein L3 [Elusimicrobiota bacterium]